MGAWPPAKNHPWRKAIKKQVDAAEIRSQIKVLKAQISEIHQNIVKLRLQLKEMNGEHKQ